MVGAVDATFLERLMVVGMDLASGYVLCEAVADDCLFSVCISPPPEQPQCRLPVTHHQPTGPAVAGWRPAQGGRR
jgi:hypothetical protein